APGSPMHPPPHAAPGLHWLSVAPLARRSPAVGPAHPPAAFLAEPAGQFLGERAAGRIDVDGKNDAVEPIEVLAAVGEIREFRVLRIRSTGFDLGRRGIGYRNGVAVSGLLQRELVALTLDDDRGFGIGNVVETVQDPFGALYLRKGFRIERPVLDVHQLAIAEIREGDAIGFAAERRDVVAG